MKNVIRSILLSLATLALHHNAYASQQECVALAGGPDTEAAQACEFVLVHWSMECVRNLQPDSISFGTIHACSMVKRQGEALCVSSLQNTDVDGVRCCANHMFNPRHPNKHCK